MEAYLDRQHHPQQALLPRMAYVALENDAVVGYIAGHLTTRHGCEGEVQYLYVSTEFRRKRIASKLLQLLAGWFVSQTAAKVCVALADDSAVEFKPFYESAGAVPLKRFWYAWRDVSIVLH